MIPFLLHRSMMTGMLPITSGEISIYGYDVIRQLPQIRRILGVCPQHNILYDR